MSWSAPATATRRITAIIIAAAALALSLRAAAHDIPNDVKIQAYVKPEGARLRLLLRVPLSAMREVDVPLRGPGYLDLARAEPALQTAARLWLTDNLDVLEDDERLGPARIASVRVTLPSDRSFASYSSALAHVEGPPLPRDMDLYWNQQLLDVLIDYPIRSEHSDFSIEPRFARLGLQVFTVLRFLPPGAPSARSSSTAIPASSGSTRAGTRRHCASSRSGSATSSKAATTCSSSYAS